MPSTNEEVIERLNRLIERNLDDSSLTVARIQRELGISRTQLHRVVKEETGLSATLYVRKIRLCKAKALLLTTQYRVSEVANATGIASPQNFSKYFVKEFGISPTELRRQHTLAGEESAKVPSLPPPLAPEPQNSEPSVSLHSYTLFKRKWPMAAAAVVLLLLAGWGSWLALASSNKSSASFSNSGSDATLRNSLAVMPFESRSEDTSFTEGVVEQLHNSLLLFTDMKVIAKTSSDQYRGTKKNGGKIGRELGVDYVLNGTASSQNNQVNIELELIGTRSGGKIWQKTYTGKRKEIFGLMNRIVRELAEELDQNISPLMAKRLDRIPTENYQAHNLYLQARRMMIDREERKLRGSLDLLDRALALDTSFAEAYAQKAAAYALMSDMGFSEKDNALNKAEQNALEAIRLDNQNATAYAILGNIYRDQYKWEQARSAYQISLKLNPNDALTLYWYSLHLRATGKPAEAMQFSTRAIELDPLHPVILGGHILNCSYAGQNDQALKSIESGKLIFEDSFIFHIARAYFHLIKRDHQAALDRFNYASRLNPEMTQFKKNAIFCEAKLGNSLLAKDYLRTLGDNAHDNLARSIVYSGMGRKDQSISYLQRAAEQGEIYFDMLIHPAFVMHHRDPRFLEILKDFGLPGPVSEEKLAAF